MRIRPGKIIRAYRTMVPQREALDAGLAPADAIGGDITHSDKGPQGPASSPMLERSGYGTVVGEGDLLALCDLTPEEARDDAQGVCLTGGGKATR